MTNEGPGKVLTPAKLADRWQCSERHVRNMIKSGELPAFKLGDKLIRIKISDVEEFERNGGWARREAVTTSDPNGQNHHLLPQALPQSIIDN